MLLKEKVILLMVQGVGSEGRGGFPPLSEG